MFLRTPETMLRCVCFPNSVGPEDPFPVYAHLGKKFSGSNRFLRYILSLFLYL